MVWLKCVVDGSCQLGIVTGAAGDLVKWRWLKDVEFFKSLVNSVPNGTGGVDKGPEML